MSLAGAVNIATVPVYQSTVKFYVFAPTATGQTALQADELVRLRIVGYASLLTSEKIVEQITKASGVNKPVQDVTNMISAFGDSNTLILTVNVQDTNQDEAFALASAVATNFNRIVNDLEGAGKPVGGEAILNVVAGPTRDNNPVSPRETLNLGLGLLVGLVIGTGILIARSRADKTLRSVQLVEREAGLALLATVPAEKKSRISPQTLGVGPATLQLEAARNLRTNLHFRSDSDSLRTIAVTSAAAGEGKSSVAINLALSCAEAGYLTLLVETDLRRPHLATDVGIESAKGLADLLKKESELLSVIFPTPRHGLWILPGGTSAREAADLLAGGAMKAFIAQARERYDVVILDTAPLLPFADARSICALSDGVILVTRYGHSVAEKVQAGKESLELVAANVLGTVFTEVPLSRSLRRKITAPGDRVGNKIPAGTVTDLVGKTNAGFEPESSGPARSAEQQNQRVET